jgi:hypothetical protein
MTWIPIPDLGQGLVLDGTPEELASGVLTAGSNMRFRGGYAERFRGMETVYTTPLVTPYHISHYQVGNTRFVVYAGLQKTYVDDGTTQTDITNANNTGGIDNRYTGGIFNGVYIQNNGVDVPQYWNGNTASNLANLTAWPAGYTVAFMRPYKNYLVAGDITRGGVRERGTFLWSHAAEPGTIPTSWDIADAAKDAGDVSLSETNGSLIDALPLGDLLAIYKDDAIHFAQPIQSSQIFRFGRLPGDTGLLARGCVVNTPAGHVLLTPDLDVVIHSGQGLRSIIDGRMLKWLANNINESQAIRSFLAVNNPTKEVLVCFPAGAATVCTKALVWNWKDDRLYIRDLANVTYGSTGQVTIGTSSTWSGASGTWDTDTNSWSDEDAIDRAPRLIFTRTAPALSMFDSTEQDHGSSFTATFERTGMHFDAPETVKLCRGVRPKIDAAAGTVVKVQIGAAMVPDVDPTWQTPVDFTVGTAIEANAFASGRFLALRMYTTADTPWRVRSVQMDVVPQGAY